ncbi:hypothetical protein N7536_012099 [Penicillium majusculum]|nr:hypothetical protein N7536_012099 [Penicillium majusculum]
MSASMASAVTFLIAAKNVPLGVLEAIIVAKEILDKVKEAAEDAEDVATVRILCHLAVSPKLNRSPRDSPSSVLLAKVSRFTERAMITNLTSWSQTSEDTSDSLRTNRIAVTWTHANTGPRQYRPTPIQALANTGPRQYGTRAGHAAANLCLWRFRYGSIFCDVQQLHEFYEALGALIFNNANWTYYSHKSYVTHISRG